MFNFKALEEKYKTNAPFNKIVNIHRQLLEEYGFLPSEIREAAFLAQYMFETNTAKSIIQTEKDWEKIEAARLILQQAILKIEEIK